MLVFVSSFLKIYFETVSLSLLHPKLQELPVGEPVCTACGAGAHDPAATQPANQQSDLQQLDKGKNIKNSIMYID